MTDQQTVKALRTEAERLWQIAIEARRAAALAEREYRVVLMETTEELIAKYDELTKQGQKEKDDNRQRSRDDA